MAGGQVHAKALRGKGAEPSDGGADPWLTTGYYLVLLRPHGYCTAMTETGGATTQGGIFYQNTVAALYLADLLDLMPAPPRERVVGVRVESPTDIDDIVVDYADGHRHFLTAKMSLRVGGKPWDGLWRDLGAEVAAAASRPNDRFTIVVAERNAASNAVEALCERAVTSVDVAEFDKRLTEDQRGALNQIGAADVEPLARFELLRRIDLRVLPEKEVEHEFSIRRSEAITVAPATFLSLLRDMVGGNARSRQLFRASPLRRRLAEEHGIRISEPPEWGIDAYRATIERDARIEIPGTGLSGPAAEVILWPLIRDWERTGRSDFEDELPPDQIDLGRAAVDLRSFPSQELHRCVLVAGPGLGKSALLAAISAILVRGAVVPVFVPLASLAASGATVADFLSEHVNPAFDVRIDWRRLAEQGLVALLLDGLDEVPIDARAKLLERLRKFSARYPRVPWLLTVRDPAVMTGANDARTLEILPLSDNDIARFAERMSAHGLQVDGAALASRLSTHPDLQRLARIPLFLALMLATLDPDGGLPTSRSDLIERYLKTLFAPHEHKPLESPALSPAILREIATQLAFQRLEAGEIGASEREIAGVVSAIVPPGEAETFTAGLVANGIMRRQSTIRFQFPFPIVQEYLAATFLVEHASETLAARVDDAIQRPWAQVLQFALELHSAPSPIMEEMLARPDDAFATALRLIARCIANGAKVEDNLRDVVGDRLVEYWAHAHWQARDRVGQLIFDAFSQPISATLRDALHQPWLLGNGGGDIISREKSNDLTLSILERLLRRPIAQHRLYFSLKPALNAVGDIAFDRILELAQAADLTEDEWSGLDDLLSLLETGSVTRAEATAAVADARFPLIIRLNCARVAGSPFLPESWNLLRTALADDELWTWRATNIMAIADNREEKFFEFLRDTSLPEGKRIELATYLGRIFQHETEREGVVKRLSNASDLGPQITSIGLLHAAASGDRLAFEQLIERLPTLTMPVAIQAMTLFGHYPGLPLVERAVELIQQRQLTSDEITQFASAGATGLRYIYDSEDGLGGTLRDAPLHAGGPKWAELLDTWSDITELADTERMTVLLNAAALGSERAKDALTELVLAIEDPDDTRYDKGDQLGHTMRQSVREVRRWRGQISLDLATRLVRSKRPNVPYAGIEAVAAHGDRQALGLLLLLHNETDDWHVRDTIKNKVETLAGKLGAFIVSNDMKLLIGSKN